MLGQFMPGIPEILVVLAIGFVLIGVPVITVIIVVVVMHHRKQQSEVQSVDEAGADRDAVDQDE